jgi:hypothetical protein
MVRPSLPYRGIARRALSRLLSRKKSISYDRTIDVSAVAIKDDIDNKMSIQLDKINTKFREIVDLLLFTDRLDLDLSKFKELLKENYAPHFEYLWDRFQKSTDIFWEEGEKFWSSRLTFLLSLNDKNLTKHIEDHLETRMFNTVKARNEVNIKYDIEYLQFLEFCKVKHSRKESLLSVRNYLTEMPSHLSSKKMIDIVSSFIPIVFQNIDEYVGVMTKKITQSARNYDLLIALEKTGIVFDKQPLVELARELILERSRTDKNLRAFFTLLNDTDVRASLKQLYNASYRVKFLELLAACDYLIIEEHHLRNYKNVVDLDISVVDELAVMYADELYNRGSGHKRANADRLIRLLKTVPQVSQKKMLVYLSSNNRMGDIKYILAAFPDLKKLAAFV